MRAPHLLPMLYPLPDLCSELGVEAATVQLWLRNGLSFERDARQHIYLHGRIVAEWIAAMRHQPGKKKPLPDGHAFCLHCRQPRPMSGPTPVYQAGKLRLLQSNCPVCGTKINRSVVE